MCPSGPPDGGLDSPSPWTCFTPRSQPVLCYPQWFPRIAATDTFILSLWVQGGMVDLSGLNGEDQASVG